MTKIMLSILILVLAVIYYCPHILCTTCLYAHRGKNAGRSIANDVFTERSCF